MYNVKFTPLFIFDLTILYQPWADHVPCTWYCADYLGYTYLNVNHYQWYVK